VSQVRQYELIYVVSSDATDQQIADLHTQVEEITGRYSGTLEKTEKKYSPTTLYKDYAISPELFHWESPSGWLSTHSAGGRPA
jgi:hypothetical protein